MPSSEPKEEQVRQAVLGKLRGITTGAGYYTDLGDNVFERRLLRAEVNDSHLPAASAFCGEEVADEACIGVAMHYGSALQLWIQAVTGAGPDGDLDLACSRVKADIKKAVLADPFLVTDSVRLLEDLEWAGANKDLDELASAGLAVVNVLFIARFDWASDAA